MRRIPLNGLPIGIWEGIDVAKEDSGADTSDTDQIVRFWGWIVAISVENIGIASWSSTREEAARKKKVVLGVEPINGFDFLLDWYLHSQSTTPK